MSGSARERLKSEFRRRRVVELAARDYSTQAIADDIGCTFKHARQLVAQESEAIERAREALTEKTHG